MRAILAPIRRVRRGLFLALARMKIDIDQLTESELIDLNNRIVERLRFLQHARAHATMLKFRIGDRVIFEPDMRGQIFGVITRYNKKSVSVLTEDGQRWTVAPNLLRLASSEKDSASTSATILTLPRK